MLILRFLPDDLVLSFSLFSFGLLLGCDLSHRKQSSFPLGFLAGKLAIIGEAIEVMQIEFQKLFLAHPFLLIDCAHLAKQVLDARAEFVLLRH